MITDRCSPPVAPCVSLSAAKVRYVKGIIDGYRFLRHSAECRRNQVEKLNIPARFSHFRGACPHRTGDLKVSAIANFCGYRSAAALAKFLRTKAESTRGKTEGQP